MKTARVAAITAVLTVACFFAMFKLGQRSERRVTWLSELQKKTGGALIPLGSAQAKLMRPNEQVSNLYFINVIVACANGKDIGLLQVDLNLRNGQLRVVRNDSKLEPNCDPSVH